MSPPPIAVVVGTGFIGPVHVEALRRIGTTVKGVVGSSPKKSRATAAALGLEQGYESYEAALADPDVAVVHLASPNRLHCSQVRAALAAGKHVICEKPLAMNSAETGELVAVAERHPHLICAVSYNIRFYPLALHARAMIQNGELGEVFHIGGSYLQDWLLEPTDFNWRVLAEEGGALRAVGDIGTHWLDLVQFVSGLEIEAVMADLRTVHPVRHRPAAGSNETFTSGAAGERASVPVEIKTEDYGSVLLRFRGGARGVLTVSQVAAGRKNCLRFEAYGAKASFVWNSETPNELWSGHRNTANGSLVRDPALLDPTAAHFASYPGGHNEGYPDTFKQFYRAVYDDIRAGRRTKRPLYATFPDAHRELLLCEAIAESHRVGTWTRVGR